MDKKQLKTVECHIIEMNYWRKLWCLAQRDFSQIWKISQLSQVVPEDKEVLFDPEALSTEVPPAAFAQAPSPTWPLLWVAVQLWELHQLVILEGVVVTRLFPHPRRVDHQGLLHQREEFRNQCKAGTLSELLPSGLLQWRERPEEKLKTPTYKLATVR